MCFAEQFKTQPGAPRDCTVYCFIIVRGRSDLNHDREEVNETQRDSDVRPNLADKVSMAF
ncbi:hypothetical protein GCM10010459_22800 [Microbacterium schleiferi]